VVLDQARRDAGLRCDAAQRGALDAALGELAQGGVANAGACGEVCVSLSEINGVVS